MLYLIGLGLGDEKDITLAGLEAVKSCDRLFLEHYTSVLGVNKEKLEKLYGKTIEIADRNMVESESDIIIGAAAKGDAALLVVGDPYCATTHTDFALRAKEKGIGLKVIHNASIMNAMGACGLQLYNFGRAVTVPFFTETWRPDSFYPKIAYNSKGGMHTLVLLDIKVKEPDYDALMKGVERFHPPRFMTVNQALEQLVEIEERRGEGVLPPETKYVGLARVGQPTQKIVAGTYEELKDIDFGAPLHSVIIVSETHELEDEMLATFAPALVKAAEEKAAAAAAESGSAEADTAAEAEAGAGAGASGAGAGAGAAEASA